MPYTLIKGKFALQYQGQRRVGSRPDGDSVWFKPNQPNLLNNLGGRSAEFNNGNFGRIPAYYGYVVVSAGSIPA